MPKTVADLRRSYRRYGIRCSANAPFMPPAHTDGRKAGSDGRFPFFSYICQRKAPEMHCTSHMGKRLLLLLLSIGCCLAGFAAESYTLRGRVIDRLTRRPVAYAAVVLDGQGDKGASTDSTGRFTTYSPYSVNAYGVPSSGRSMSMNFSLSQNLEMKVLSKRDTSGVKKIKLIDELRISGSYNFLADSMRLSTIPISFRTTLFQNFGINLSMTLDPYRLTPDGKRYNKLFFPGRIVSTGWSFGYTFKSRDDRSQSAINDITSIPPEYMNPYYDPYGNMDPVLRRQYMSQMYYDFSLPWNFGFNYAINYNISTGNYPPKGYKKNVTQTVSFNGSLTITPKTGITFQGGYDIKANKLTTSSISISRDLHCWQMSFSWIPFGFHRSWSFNIGVKAASLSDLKYDKSQSMYDNMY